MGCACADQRSSHFSRYLAVLSAEIYFENIKRKTFKHKQATETSFAFLSPP